MRNDCKWVVENTIWSFFQDAPYLNIFSLALYFWYILPVQIHNSAYTLSDLWVLYFIPVPQQLHLLGKQDNKISRPQAETNSLGKISSNSSTTDGNLLEANASIYPKFHSLFKCLVGAAGPLIMESHLVKRLMLLWIFSWMIPFMDRLNNEISWIMRGTKLL